MGTTKHLVFREIINRGLYEEYLNFAAYMRITQGMSYFNSALVIVQRPGAVCVRTEHAWYRDYGRTIKPGVTPIVIMKLGDPVSFVYDISDTVGEKAPVRLKNILECHDVMTPLGNLYTDLRGYTTPKACWVRSGPAKQETDIPLRCLLNLKEERQ